MIWYSSERIGKVACSLIEGPFTCVYRNPNSCDAGLQYFVAVAQTKTPARCRGGFAIGDEWGQDEMKGIK